MQNNQSNQEPSTTPGDTDMQPQEVLNLTLFMRNACLLLIGWLGFSLAVKAANPFVLLGMIAATVCAGLGYHKDAKLIASGQMSTVDKWRTLGMGGIKKVSKFLPLHRLIPDIKMGNKE